MGFKKYIKRQVEQRIKQLFESFPLIFLTGPRQSGKTTLLKHLFPDFNYFNLETPATLSRAKEDPLGFLSPSKIILDEAQKAPWLFSYLLELVDKEKKQVVIAGSQNLLLHQKISQSLAGRVALVELFPFTLSEIKEWLPDDIETIILKGGYPRVYQIKEKNIFDWYQGYLHTYLERDVRHLKNIKDLLVFQDFIQLLAGQAGGLLNLNSISNNLGISATTLRQWLSVLEASYLVFRLRPYFANIRKRLTKRPKIYFYDTGLLATILAIKNKQELKNHPLYGQIFENFIVAEIIKTFSHFNFPRKIYFLRDKTGNEIDLLWPHYGQKLSALEIKTSATFNPNFIKKIEYFRQFLPLDRGFVVYKGEAFTFKGIRIIPWSGLADQSLILSLVQSPLGADHPHLETESSLRENQSRLSE